MLGLINDKMRKDLQAAHELASHNHPLSFFKHVLQQFQEELEQAKAAQLVAQTTPSKKSKKTKAAAEEEEEDVEMPDVDEEEAAGKEKKPKKRKADDTPVCGFARRLQSCCLLTFSQVPQRSDSVKKPKIKLTSNSTPKAANGVQMTPKSSKASASKPSKSKSSKERKAEEKKTEEVQVPKEPELSLEEKHMRKEVRTHVPFSRTRRR